MRQNVVGRCQVGGGVAGAFRSMQLEFARVLNESFLVPVLIYGSETMIWRENQRSRIRAVQMDNLRGLPGIKRMDKVLNAETRELCG